MFSSKNAEGDDASNRVKLFVVYEKDVLLTCVTDVDDLYECFTIGRRAKLPFGSKIMRVSYDFSRRAFLFLVQNDSFYPVPRWASAPIEPDPIEFSNIVAVRLPDGHYRIDDVANLFPERKS